MKLKCLFCTFLILYSVAFTGSANDVGIPRAKNGVIDLRNQNFEKKISLNGEWIFYWKQLVNPKNTTLTNGKAINFPGIWNNLTVNGEKLSSFGYASYELTVLLPKRNTILRVSMPDVYCAYSLFLNGEEVAKNGKVSSNAKDFEPHWQYRAFDVPAGIDTARLVLQIANFVHSKGGIKKEISIGQKSEIEIDRQRTEAIDFFLTGCLFMGGLFFLGLFLLGNRDKQFYYFLYTLLFTAIE